MLRTTLLLIGALAVAGCAVTPPPSTARLPPGAFYGNADNNLMAINFASWAWSDPERTHGKLVDGALAVMAIDYLGGELTSNPQYMHMARLTKLDMLRARTEVREAVGIAPNAPSQNVVDALFQFSRSPSETTAARVMTPPVFTLPPKDVVARLGDLPYLPLAAQASHMASAQQFPGGRNLLMP